MFKNIKSIKNFGIFKDTKMNAGQPFLQFNLIYGFNYSGKTTLSRIFRAMQQGLVHEDFTTASFVVDRYEGEAVSSATLTPIANLRVFNSDYIKDNVNFVDSSVNPVLMVGERNIELEDELKHLEETLIPAEQGTWESLKDLAESKEKEKNKRLQDVAKLVNTLSILGNSKFDIRGVRTLLPQVSSQDLKTDKERLQLEETARSQKSEPVSNAFIKVPNTAALLDQIQTILAESVTRTTIEELEANVGLRQWVEDGIKHHGKAKTCQFCKSPLEQVRLDELNAYFSDSYKALSQKISAAIKQVGSIKLGHSVPKATSLYPDLITNFEQLVEQIPVLEEQVERLKNRLLEVLEDKRSRMEEVVPFLQSDYQMPIASKLLEQFNIPIGEHNRRSREHNKEQTVARDAIKRHFVYVETMEYDQIKAYETVVELQQKQGESEGNLLRLKGRVMEIKAALRNVKQGADNLNDNLSLYFGKTDIEIQPVGETYQFMREGRPAKHLSDGERTAIAFAYFITELEDESLKDAKPIVYLDDPICSLDSNHIYNVLGIIKDKLNHDKVEQLFISTHNFEFFNLVKTWFDYYKLVKRDGDVVKPKRAEFYLVNRKQNASTVEQLPKNLKDHKSEYAYLIAKIKEAVRNPEQFDAVAVQAYVRKILEVYFTFRFNKPFRANNNSFLEKHLLNGIDNSSAKATTLYEFINERSHAQSISFGVELPDALQAQLQGVWDIIDEAIRTNDHPHYEAYYV
ncbi:AAA family ATPase [Vibrio sp. 10N.261.55.C5]|uniref:AAA family ATPase n=1 Tax=Vibrio sp. 10N.261.55.C5 TaxID=3229689 RepID=UPI00354C2B3D